MTTTTATNTNPASSIYEALSSSKTSSSTASANATTDMQDRFLKLLVTQLKNQDPLNPMDNAQMTSQMAQISTVDGIEKLNTTLQALMSNATESQSMEAAALVGHGVLVPGSNLSLSSGAAYGGVELSGPADKVTVTIKDGNGLVVRTMELGSKEAGAFPFQWDGKADNGNTAVDGNYTFSVSAKQGSNTVTTTALGVGMVSSIMRSSQSISLNVGNLGLFKMSDVREIL